jgi:hypothetical protein
MTESSAAPALRPAIDQIGQPDGALNSATCGVMVERVAQIAAGRDG